MPVSAMDLDDFVALLVDSDVHISSDAVWGRDRHGRSWWWRLHPQWQVQVAHIPDRLVALEDAADEFGGEEEEEREFPPRPC